MREQIAAQTITYRGVGQVGTESRWTRVRFMAAEEAVQHVRSGDSVMVSGFGASGIPEYLLHALARRPDVEDLTVISNNITANTGLDTLFRLGKIRKVIGTYFTSNPEVVRAHREGRVDIELMCQGTFAEAIRLGGAGIPAFYTPTGAGTDLARGKETRVFDGRPCVLERSLTADVALVRAHKADGAGNVVYRKAARQFAPLMAAAARLTIVEVDEVVEVGELDPEAIVTPFIFVDIVVRRQEE
jgi:3-oxoacid CoA-transferase subunit A